MTAILNTAYWPNLQYMHYVLDAEGVVIEQHETYAKQSFRNRTQILSANGVLDLSIPVQSAGNNEITKNIKISYAQNWQIRHWRAITSAYKNSPYFDFFEDEIKVFYTEKEDFLLGYNLKQIDLLKKILRQKIKLELSKGFEKIPVASLDLREKIHPKISFDTDKTTQELLSTPYYQTFSAKMPFVPNLSILDLLFNCGLESKNYLLKKT
jgi:hypothetical protein